MIKKILTLVIASIASLTVVAQHSPGSWKVMPLRGYYNSKIVDTPERLYMLSYEPLMKKNSMFHFDKVNNENYYYTPGDKLSGTSVKDIFYNKEGKYLFVAYNDANIDIIFDDGRLVNFPEIADANLNYAKDITNVTFSKDYAYVATKFGFVVLDIPNNVVKESVVFGTPVKNVWPVGDYIFMVSPKDQSLVFSPKNARHNKIESFENTSNFALFHKFHESPQENTFVGVNTTAGRVSLVKFKPENKSLDILVRVTIEGIKDVQPSRQGWTAIGTSKIVTLSPELEVIEEKPLPEELQTAELSSWKGVKELWSSTRRGYGSHDLSGNTPVMLSDRAKPFAAESWAARNFAYDFSDNSVIFGPATSHEIFNVGREDADAYMHVWVVLDKYNWQTGDITQVHPTVLDGDGKFGQINDHENLNNRNNPFNCDDHHIGGPGHFVIDPVDPSIIYMPVVTSGVHVYKDGKLVNRFYDDNSPILCGWDYHVNDLTFDSNGNLWTGAYLPAIKVPGVYYMLPKTALDRLRANPSVELTKNDWKTTKFNTVDYGGRNLDILRFSGNKGLFVGGPWGQPIFGYDTKGTDSTSDDVIMQYGGFTDQDGTLSTPVNKFAMDVDKNGHFWIGTSAGVFVVKDLQQLANPASDGLLHVIRPKVSREDGTVYADYLLSSESITSIATDANNNKWIGTEASGIYKVNEDGTEILEHFTKNNSPLMSNLITLAIPNPEGNDVLIFTPDSYYLYSASSSPAAEDYSEVYAYPNPVRPDYSGWITIQGLMDNSLVKIADAQGHVIYTTRSEGGMVVWDGCDASGARVRSGVYLVFASQNNDGSSSGVVTKIVVIQ